MAKPDPAFLDPARYPFHCDLGTRYTDVDINLHVNNVAIVEIMQEARVRYHRACAFDLAESGLTGMTVSFAVEYVGEAHYGETLANHVGTVALGRTSQTLAQLITQDARPVAFARTVIVSIVDGSPVENPPELIESVGPWMIDA